MKTGYISTTALWNSPRTSLNALQSKLTVANTELTAGRHADVGLHLGAQIGQAISLREDRSELDALLTSNVSVLVRLKASSSALSGMREEAVAFRNSLVATPRTNQSLALIMSQAGTSLSNLLAGMNKEAAGQYLFGGVNTKEGPIKEYSTEAKAAVELAFFQAFGFEPDSPDVSTISPPAMKDFIDKTLVPAFTEKWNDILSSASDHNIQSLISPNRKLETSVNANEKAFQHLAVAYTMIFDLGLDRLGEPTKDVLISSAIEYLSQGANAVTALEARLGVVQKSVEDANEQMDLQKLIMDEKIGRLENVDLAEAKTRIDQLMVQIEMSYSLTAQLRQFSLLKYL